jgi:hypothetical protein
MATTLETPAGTLATVPMGDPGHALDTFWQLLVRPAGSRRWYDRTSFGIATNGGLALAAEPAPGSSFLVGTRPANLLSYSAVAASSDVGLSWSARPPVPALADRTSSLALSGSGRGLALVARKRGQVVMALEGNETWVTIGTTASIASTVAARRCRIESLVSVAFAGDVPLVGAECGRPGSVGLFAEEKGSWIGVAAPLLPALSPCKTEVLALETGAEGSRMLVALGGTAAGCGSRLVSGFSRNGMADWSFSPPLVLPRGARIVSEGEWGGSSESGGSVDGGPGTFVLWSDGSLRPRLDFVTGPGGSWASLPVPLRTAAVALPPGGPPEALAVDRATLTVWEHRGGSWDEVQTMNVPIQFGSSG